jgi:hypothetical protein
MAKSGIGATIDSIPDQFDYGLQQAPMAGRIPAPILRTLRDTAREVFAPENMREELKARLLAEMTREEMASILEFLRTNLGRKMVALEQALVDPAVANKAHKDGMALRREYQQNNPERLELTEEYLRATRAVKHATDLIIDMQTAIAVGIRQADSPQSPPAITRIRRQLEQQRTNIAGRVGHMVTTEILYAYREASNAELRAYLDFLQTTEGRRFSRDTFRAFSGLMSRRARLLGNRIGEKIRAMKKGKSDL